MAVGHHVDAGISTDTLCNSNKSLTLPGHLAPILFNHDFIIFLMMISVWGIIVFNVVHLCFTILYYFRQQLQRATFTFLVISGEPRLIILSLACLLKNVWGSNRSPQMLSLLDRQVSNMQNNLSNAIRNICALFPASRTYGIGAELKKKNLKICSSLLRSLSG